MRVRSRTVEFRGGFTVVCHTLGFQHTCTQPRHAWTNGFVERLQGAIQIRPLHTDGRKYGRASTVASATARSRFPSRSVIAAIEGPLLGSVRRRIYPSAYGSVYGTRETFRVP